MSRISRTVPRLNGTHAILRDIIVPDTLHDSRPCRVVATPFVYFHSYLFSFNETSTTPIYTLSLHDALPIFDANARQRRDDHHPVLLARLGIGAIDRRG